VRVVEDACDDKVGVVTSRVVHIDGGLQHAAGSGVGDRLEERVRDGAALVAGRAFDRAAEAPVQVAMAGQHPV
jgi:hypothetical protein